MAVKAVDGEVTISIAEYSALCSAAFMTGGGHAAIFWNGLIQFLDSVDPRENYSGGSHSWGDSLERNRTYCKALMEKARHLQSHKYKKVDVNTFTYVPKEVT